MPTRTVFLTLLLGLTLLFSACAGQSPALESTSWSLTQLQGQSVLQPAPTLSFAGGQVSGNASCNSFGGEYTVRGDKLTFGALMSTLMACVDSGRMEQESTFFAALASVVSYQVEGQTLRLQNADGVSVAEFTQKPAPVP